MLSCSICSAVTGRPFDAAATPATIFERSNGSRSPWLLIDHQRHFLEPFVRGEAVLAARAQTATADGRAFLGLARIDHLGVVGMAFRAPHRRPRLVDGSWQRESLRDLYLGAAVGRHQLSRRSRRATVCRGIAADRPHRVAGLDDVHVGGGAGAATTDAEFAGRIMEAEAGAPPRFATTWPVPTSSTSTIAARTRSDHQPPAGIDLRRQSRTRRTARE